MMDRIIFLGTEIDDYTANTLQAQLLYLDSVDSGKDISIYRTVSGGQFDWGGRLQKSNGGAQRFPQSGRKSLEECKGRRELDCETDRSSRDESRA